MDAASAAVVCRLVISTFSSFLLRFFSIWLVMLGGSVLPVYLFCGVFPVVCVSEAFFLGVHISWLSVGCGTGDSVNRSIARSGLNCACLGVPVGVSD